MLTDGKADSVKIHILDNKLFAELLCYVSRKLHINAVVILALGVLKRLESGVGSNYKLIFALVESCGLDCNGGAVAEVVVADLIKSAVGLDLLEDLVDLCKQLGLSLINAECILFIGKIIFDDLNFLCCGSGGSSVAALSPAGVVAVSLSSLPPQAAKAVTATAITITIASTLNNFFIWNYLRVI